MDTLKFAFMVRTQYLAEKLAVLARELQDMSEVWDHRQYGPGGTNEITVEDLTNPSGGVQPLSPDAMYAFIILCAQLNNFMSNQPVAASDYKSTLDRARGEF